MSQESNRINFSSAELQADFKLSGVLALVGAGSDNKPMNFRGRVLRFEPPRVFQYTFAMGQKELGQVPSCSGATNELLPCVILLSHRLNPAWQRFGLEL